MKKYCFTLLAIFVFTGIYSQNKANFEKEKAAIIATIKEEKKGYAELDMEMMKKNIVTDSSYTFIYADENTLTIRRGFADQEEIIKSWWNSEDFTKTKSKHDYEIIEVKIHENTAWLAINNNWEHAGDEQAVKRHGLSVETFFLQKINDKWKISGQHIVSREKTIYSIGIAGSSLPGGWNQSVDLTKSEESLDTWEGLFNLNDGELKFRANNNWLINWGGSGFPSGTLIPHGDNIKITKGRYHVLVKLNTNEYKFSVVK